MFVEKILLERRKNHAVPVSDAALEVFYIISCTTGRRFSDLVDSFFLTRGHTLNDLSPAMRERYMMSRHAVGGLSIKPIGLSEANEYVRQHHRHHGSIPGMKFAIGLVNATGLRGVAIAARPVARHIDDDWTLEIRRLATDGVVNGPSMLLGAVRRAAKAMGYSRLITYTLPQEGGASLRAAGWRLVGKRGGGKWSRKSRPRYDSHPTEAKLLWEAVLDEQEMLRAGNDGLT